MFSVLNCPDHPTSYPVGYQRLFLQRGVKWLGFEAGYSPTTLEAKKRRIHAYALHMLSCCCAELLKHKDNFTLFMLYAWAHSSIVVKALCYKMEGRGFET
jgi:hypothetical protein